MPGRLAIHRVALPPSYPKTCTRCQRELPRSKFSLDYRRRDCYQPWCHECHHRSRVAQGPKSAPGFRRLPRIDQPPESLKTCYACMQELPRSSFHRDRHRPDGCAMACRSCRGLADKLYKSEKGNEVTEKRRARRAANPEHFRNYQLKWSHGVTIVQYNEILERQGGVCAICRGPQAAPHKFLCVDHCHTTGKIRGLLCSPCNKSLGLLKDDPEILLAAARYLGAT